MRVSKEDAEKVILDRFLAAYRKRFGVELKVIAHQDKPDFKVSDPESGRVLGIEVTGAYQDTREARIQYSTNDTDPKVEASIDEVLASINARLSDKTAKLKSYVFDGEIWLVILIGSLVYHSKSDIDSFRGRIVIPENLFTKIWLIIRNDIDYSPELYQLQ